MCLDGKEVTRLFYFYEKKPPIPVFVFELQVVASAVIEEVLENGMQT